jgi:hypothetical protein
MIDSSLESPQCIARSFALVMRSFAQSNTGERSNQAGSFLFVPAPPTRRSDDGALSDDLQWALEAPMRR